MILTKEQIDEMFDEKFKVSQSLVWTDGIDYLIEVTGDEIKYFIHTIRESDRAEIIREVEERWKNVEGINYDEDNEKAGEAKALYELKEYLLGLGIPKE